MTWAIGMQNDGSTCGEIQTRMREAREAKWVERHLKEDNNLTMRRGTVPDCNETAQTDGDDERTDRQSDESRNDPKRA